MKPKNIITQRSKTSEKNNDMKTGLQLQMTTKIKGVITIQHYVILPCDKKI